MAVFDTMRHIRPDVSTVCVGLAASMGAFLLASGHQGKRYSLANSRIMIHQPLGGAQGQAADIEIQVRAQAGESRRRAVWAGMRGLPGLRSSEAAAAGGGSAAQPGSPTADLPRVACLLPPASALPFPLACRPTRSCTTS